MNAAAPTMPSRRLPEALRVPITDLASAKAWVETLYREEMSFHFEDDPADIISYAPGDDGTPLFDPEDIPVVAAALEAAYELEWGAFSCPIGFLLALMAEGGDVPWWAMGETVKALSGEELEVVKVGMGLDRHRAILKAPRGYLLASRNRESYAANSFTDDAEERATLFSSIEDAMAEAGGLWGNGE